MTDLSAEALAKESERLRTDAPFAAAVKTMSADAQKELAAAEQAAIAALLAKQDTGEAESRILLARATIAAINGLTTAIAHQILRGTPREKPPVA